MQAGYRQKKQERRENMRIHRLADVEVETVDHRVIRGMLRDISLKSLYLNTDEGNSNFLIEGEQVKVRISMRDRTSVLAISVDAGIIRLDDSGFALIFAHSLKWWPIFVTLPGARARSKDGIHLAPERL